MANIARGPKAAGGTSFTTGAIIAAEVNYDLDTAYNKINGNLDEDSLSLATQIPNALLVDIDAAKVTDHAETAAVFLTATSGGDTGTPVLPTDLEGELEALRYSIGANKSISNGLKFRATSGTMTAAGWTEPPIVGFNLMPNAGFEVHSGSSTDAPDGWTLVGTVSSIAIEAAADVVAGLYKRSTNITTSAATSGISVILSGLRASKKYLVGVAYTRTAGEMNVTTTNALGSGDYKDLAFSDSTTTTIMEFQGIVKSDASATDITVSITGTSSGANFNLHRAWFYEMGVNSPWETPHIPMQTATYTTADDVQTSAGPGGVWDTKTDLSLSQYIPMEGYRMIYEATLTFVTEAQGGGSDVWVAFRIQQNIDAGGATTVEGPIGFVPNLAGATSVRASASVTLKYILENPTPGSTYAFTVDAFFELDGALNTIFFNPTVGSVAPQATQSSSRLYFERI